MVALAKERWTEMEKQGFLASVPESSSSSSLEGKGRKFQAREVRGASHSLGRGLLRHRRSPECRDTQQRHSSYQDHLVPFQVADEMYFISKGEVSVLVSKGKLEPHSLQHILFTVAIAWNKRAFAFARTE